MGKWLAKNITWVVGTLGVWLVSFTAYLVKTDMSVSYLLKRDTETRNEYKIIIEKLGAIETKLAVVADRQERRKK